MKEREETRPLGGWGGGCGGGEGLTHRVKNQLQLQSNAALGQPAQVLLLQGVGDGLSVTDLQDEKEEGGGASGAEPGRRQSRPITSGGVFSAPRRYHFFTLI